MTEFTKAQQEIIARTKARMRTTDPGTAARIDAQDQAPPAPAPDLPSTQQGGVFTPEQHQILRQVQERQEAVVPGTQERDVSALGIADTASEALGNLPASTAQLVSDVTAPIHSPLETVNAMLNLAAGTGQLLIPGEQSMEKYAVAAGQHFKDRYGGLDAAKKTFVKDPAGFLADMSMVLTGGGMAGARLPGVAGKAARATQTTGRAIDPMRLPGRAARGVLAPALGVLTGTGARPITTTAQAARTGGAASEASRASLRGDIPAGDVVQEARDTLGAMRQTRGREYAAAMDHIDATHRQPLSFGRVRDAVQRVENIKQFKGVSISPTIRGARKQVADILTKWEQRNPAEFHTPSGFDAMKQELWDAQARYERGTPEYTYINQVRRGVVDTIGDQVPEYRRVMGDYERATNLISEIERTLSANPGASIDTSLRKLQSVMRDNVNTNFGYRFNLAQALQDAGGPNLIEKLGGQALNPGVPVGLSRLSAQMLGNAAVIGGAALNPAIAAGAAPLLALQSPRLIGEAARAGGKAAGILDRAADFAGLGRGSKGRAGLLAGRARDAVVDPAEEERERERLLAPFAQ